MVFERINEALFFWRTHILALALIVVPYSLLTTGGEIWFGQAIAISGSETNPEFQFNGMAMFWAFIVPVLTEAALIPQLAAIQAEKPRSLGQCTLIGFACLPTLLIANIITAMALAVGLFFLILPGLWIFMRLSFAPFIVILEQQSAMDALKQSFERTEAIQFPLLGAWLLTLLAILSITNIAGAILLQVLGDHAGSRLILGVLVALGAALLHVLLFRFYGLTQK